MFDRVERRFKNVERLGAATEVDGVTMVDALSPW